MKQNIEAHMLGATLGMHRFLSDSTEARNVDSVTDDCAFANDEMQTNPQINRYALVAILVSPDVHSHNFFETVAINAGPNAHIFTDREAAIHFLMKDLPQLRSDR